MAQHSGVIADQAGLAFLSDLNNALMADKTLNSGATEPATKYAGMLWLDTSGATPVLKQRNQANDAWANFGAQFSDDIRAASETQAGVVEKATAGEAQAFTADKYIDGARLASAFGGPNQSLAASGYQKLPGGLILQWGSVILTGTVRQKFTLPMTFPTAFLSGVAGDLASADASVAVSVGTGSTQSQIELCSTTAGASSVNYFCLGN